MQDDLIERLRRSSQDWQDNVVRWKEAIEAAGVTVTDEQWQAMAANLSGDSLARIAALEADNARLMGLVKEAQSAIRFFKMTESSATLAKIKEATDAPVK